MQRGGRAARARQRENAPTPSPVTPSQALAAAYAARALLMFWARLDRELVAPFQPLLEDPDSLTPVRARRGGHPAGRQRARRASGRGSSCKDCAPWARRRARVTPRTPTPRAPQLPRPCISAPPTKSLTIVVPAYNEEDRLPATLDETLK